MSWKDILIKAPFTFDPQYNLGNTLISGEVKVGLPKWKEKLENRPEWFPEGEESLVQEISNTIGHEYTHVATLEEVRSKRNEALEDIITAYKNKQDYTKPLEVLAVTDFMNEMMARAAHGKRQITSFLKQGALSFYAEQTIGSVVRATYNSLTNWDNDSYPDGVPKTKIRRKVESGEEFGLQDLFEKASEVISRKMMELAIKFRPKYEVEV